MLISPSAVISPASSWLEVNLNQYPKDIGFPAFTKEFAADIEHLRIKTNNVSEIPSYCIGMLIGPATTVMSAASSYDSDQSCVAMKLFTVYLI